MVKTKTILDPKKRYLQIALNGTLEDARSIIGKLPNSDRIILEAGTPFIKRYGEKGIKQICDWYTQHLSGLNIAYPSQEINDHSNNSVLYMILQNMLQNNNPARTKRTSKNIFPYVVADLKTMDRAETEVAIAARAGACAVTALGSAPIETLNSFIEQCEALDLDSMIDMMNVEFPLTVIRSLKKPPSVVIIHRGVDEERFNREKQIPLHEIRRLKGNYNLMISIAGGDTIREVQRSIFNSADIVVVWKSVYEKTDDTISLIESFLREIK